VGLETCRRKQKRPAVLECVNEKAAPRGPQFDAYPGMGVQAECLVAFEA
jgi:hypothetical protein